MRKKGGFCELLFLLRLSWEWLVVVTVGGYSRGGRGCSRGRGRGRGYSRGRGYKNVVWQQRQSA
jgi:hypothetical protein